MALRVWLIRHGLTWLGEEKRYQGSLDDGLSTAGRTALKRASFTPDHVYVSPAARARETAEVLFPEAEQRVCEALREMNFGVFEGRGWWEMEDDAEYRAWTESGCIGRCPGGENREEFTERICSGFDEILEREAGESDMRIKNRITAEAVPANKSASLKETYGTAITYQSAAADETDEEVAGFTEDLIIVAHGGTQMALLDRRGLPRREYYCWQRPCGCGWLLEYLPETGMLHAIREIAFLR